MGVVVWGNYGDASSIQLPTWSAVNGQNDLRWYNPWLALSQGIGSAYILDVYKSNHGNETGEYITHVYINGVAKYGGLRYTIR